MDRIESYLIIYLLLHQSQTFTKNNLHIFCLLDFNVPIYPKRLSHSPGPYNRKSENISENINNLLSQ